MSLYFVPFNHQPVARGQNSTSYTVPAGKYARVRINYTISAWMEASDKTNANLTTAISISTSPGNISGSLEIWAVAGDAITYTTTVASVSPNLNVAGAGFYFDMSSDYTQIQIKVNTVVIATYRAAATGGVAANFSGATTLNYGTYSGQATAAIHYEEYLVIT